MEAEAILTVIPAPRISASINPSSGSSGGGAQRQSGSGGRRAPYFIRAPESVEVVTGQTVELPCQAEGNPQPTVVWRKDGQTMRDSATVSSSSNDGNLIIRDVTRSDEGTYECTALNDMGVIVARAQMRVKGCKRYLIVMQ